MSEPPSGAQAAALLHFLNAQRGAVLAILDGLTDEQLNAAVLPSGWTPLGLVEHLTDAEWRWFQHGVCGVPWEQATWRLRADPQDSTGSEGGDEPGFVSRRPSAEVIDDYRAMCARNDAVVAERSLDTPLADPDTPEVEDDVADLRWVVLHLIEETARHAGHLDVVRELIDGTTGLGPR